MATLVPVARPPATLTLPQRIGFAALALGGAGALGGALGLGTPLIYLIAGLIAPFLLLLILVRPYWAAAIYVVLVYGDILSILTRYNGLPALARFVGIALLSTVVGYRLIIRRRPLVRDELTLWLVAYGLMVAAGIWYAQDPSLVQANVTEFIRNFLTYLIIINTVTNPTRLRGILWALLAFGTALALLTVYQSATGQTTNDLGGFSLWRVSEISGGNDAPRPGGNFGDANYYGQFLLIVLPLGLYLTTAGGSRPARLAGLGSTAILTLAIVYTYSRGDALALLAVFAAAAIYKRPNPLYLAAGAVGLLLALPLLPPGYLDRLTTILDTATGNTQTIYNEASIRGRAGATQAAIAMFLDHPLVGVGRENYPLHELDYLAGSNLAYKSTGIPPHDLYLEVAAEHGLLGLLVVGGALLAVGRALRAAHRRFRAVGDTAQADLTVWLGISLFGYLVSSLFLHGAYLYMLWLQVALIVALRQIARTAPPTPAHLAGKGR